MELVSIIICTHNRAAVLLDTLRTLAVAVRQYGHSAEVIVVDNNCTDTTPAAVDEFCAAHPDIDCRYLRETQPGLSCARNAAIAAARGHLLCFLDDDILVPEGWLTSLLGTQAHDQHIGCIAGQIKLHWPERAIPDWIDAKYHGFYGRFFHGEDDCLLPHGAGFFGGNFVLKREVIERVGLFDGKLGRVGKTLLSGEDGDYATRLAAAGFRLSYSAHGYIYHRVSPERLTFCWLWQRYFWQGVTVGYFPRNRYWWYPLKWLPKLLTNALLLPLLLVTGNRTLVYRTCFRIANALGPLCGRLMGIAR